MPSWWWRTSSCTAIPISIAVTFIALRIMNQSFNLMTLGGLAAAVGLVIDDAIVVVENIVMHRDSDLHRRHLHRFAHYESEFQPDDAWRVGCGRWVGHRRCHRGGGEHRHAPRFRSPSPSPSSLCAL